LVKMLGSNCIQEGLPPGGLAHARPDDLEAFPSGLGHAASGTTYLPTR
jgi:hypothetical protein